MTGYQRAKIVAMWLKSGKTLTLDEFAATVDMDEIVDPNPIVREIQPINLETVQRVFGI